MDLRIRPARTSDVRRIRELVDLYSQRRILLSKATVTLFEDVPDFLVAELDGQVVGCGAMHVIWEDLGELRTLAVDPPSPGRASDGPLSRRCWGAPGRWASRGSSA